MRLAFLSRRCLPALLFMLLTGCGHTPTSQAADGAGSFDPQALLRRWYDDLAATKTLSVDIKAQFQAIQNGEEVQAVAQESTFALRKPAELRLTARDETGLTIVNDGKQLYEAVGQMKRYARRDPFTSVADLITKSVLTSQLNMQQGLSILGDALAAKSFDDFYASLGKVEAVGVEELEGAKAHRIRTLRDGVPTEVFLAGDAPRLVRVAPDLKTIAAKNGRQLPPGVELKLTLAFTGWKYDAPAADGAFAFTPPSDYELVDDLFAPPPHPLLGKQAPAIELTTLDDAKFNLAEQAGKVVVLDFWATWCGPCVAALPKITETTAKYKDKGVIFYAVNVQEEAPIIREFLTAQKLAPPVLLDSAGKASEAFGVSGIPQTVVIDKAGKIQVIHVGAGPEIGTQLAKELDDVLAGKQLADEKLKKK